jgi:hypothetical protein
MVAAMAGTLRTIGIAELNIVHGFLAHLKGNVVSLLLCFCISIENGMR